MKVILLAAGRSRRAKPIEDKNFIVFCGKTLLHRQLDTLRDAGFEEVLILGGAHNQEALKEAATLFSAESLGRVQVEVTEQEDLEQGMAGAVESAHGFLKKRGETEVPVLIVSTNDVVEQDAYRSVLEAAQNPNYDAALLGKKVDQYFPGGYLELGEAGRVLGIVEKPGEGNEPSEWINLVVHFHRSLETLAKTLGSVNSDRDDRYEQAIAALIQQGKWIQAVPYEGYWQAIKYPWHVRAVARHFYSKEAPRISAKAVIEDGARVQGDVVVEEGVRIMAGATVVGPAYLGKNTLVATNALVRDAQVGERCVIGFGTEVARSVLGNDVWTHTNYLGDSVIGNDVSFGAGSVTGNLRFDEGPVTVEVDGARISSGESKLGLFTGDHIRVGINTSFMPGVKVGSRSLIGAGLVIDRNIPENSFVKGTVTLDIRPNTAPPPPSRESFRNALGS